jgi:5-oxopent-3-ene-1,2,5-tricarboxylate decarboxylase / 2-hydroxyhepta-2,4-diene-1,7-dioate isomerase
MRAVLPSPSKVIGVHLNFHSRAAERGRTPDTPSYFLKPPSSVTGDGELVRPPGAELLGFEGEIAVIVGKQARQVERERAGEFIGWYAAANDVGVADFRWADRGSAVLSKGQDGFTPIGPPIPAEDVSRQGLCLRTLVDGEVVQNDGIEGMVFDFEYLIADLSRFITLERGDIILTGTPAGAGPIEPGSVVEVDLAGLSRVRSVVVDGADAPAPLGAQPRVTAEAEAFAKGSAARFRLSAGAREALRRVSVATLTVQLSRRGIRDTFIRGVRPSRPDLRLLGYAATLRYVPLREDVRDGDRAELNAQKAAIESIGPEDVLVIEAREDPGAGTIGDILAARAAYLGAAGIVTDGGARDTGALASIDMPIYYQRPHGAVLGLKHFPLESGRPVTCGGVLVMPGDVIVGDADGALVIPQGLAEEVAFGALEQEEREQWALERVQAGESVRGVYPLSEARREDFETWRAGRRPEKENG